MRSRDELDSDVNVELRAQRARERTNGSGKLPRPVHSAEAVVDQDVTLWERIRRSIPTPEDLLVAGRAVRGIVVTPTMGLTIVLALGTVIGTMYWRTSDRIDRQNTALQERIDRQNTSVQETHDLLIRLGQRLIDKNERDNERFQNFDTRFGSVEAWQQVTNRDLATLGIKHK